MTAGTVRLMNPLSDENNNYDLQSSLVNETDGPDNNFITST